MRKIGKTEGGSEEDAGEASVELETEVEVLLDDNGFPLVGDRTEEDGEVYASISGQRDGSFASEFYSCGTDWSCLLPEEEGDYHGQESCNVKAPMSSEKKLKQADLFQMWGLAKKKKQQQQMNPQDQRTALSLFRLPPTNTNKLVKAGNFAACPEKASPSYELSMDLRKRTIGAGPRRNGQRFCPFYKKIPGTPFTVDAFRYGCIQECSAYFLTHFHSDHYGGLTKAWCHGPIYCSPLTATLLRICLSVNPSLIHPLELSTQHCIEGIKVTFLEANHCPGAVLIHFRLPNGQCYLHTGDFRASKQMKTYFPLVNYRVNVLYLDTTYCNPKYNFPSKDDVLSYVVRVTKDCLKKQPKTLLVVGAYSIGKECVYLAIAKALKVQIFANSSRRRVLKSFGWYDLSGSLCSDGKDTLLHVLPISSLQFESLRDYLKTYKNQYNAVLAFRPTGWTYSETVGNQLYRIRPRSKGNISIYGVPYSEHSSFTELQEFVQFLRPEKIIPTVNVGNATNRDQMQSYFREWLRN